MSEKPKWKSIKVPEPVYQKIVNLSLKLNRHMYQIVEQAVDLLDLYRRKPYKKKELPRLDKCAWYIFKLANGIGTFKVKYDLEEWRKLMNTVEQIRTRLGIDTSELEHVLLRLKPEKDRHMSTSDRIELNDVAKMLIADIIVKMLFEEEETAKA